MNVIANEEGTYSTDVAKAINLASAEVEKNKSVEWEKYTTKITESDNFYIINFHYKDTPTGYRGSLPGTPNFTVKIQKRDYKIIESYINR